jgi:hypothetical protein
MKPEPYSQEATKLIVQTVLRTARPDQLRRLLDDIFNNDNFGQGPSKPA